MHSGQATLPNQNLLMPFSGRVNGLIKTQDLAELASFCQRSDSSALERQSKYKERIQAEERQREYFLAARVILATSDGATQGAAPSASTSTRNFCPA
jgi:hypothetical protein